MAFSMPSWRTNGSYWRNRRWLRCTAARQRVSGAIIEGTQHLLDALERGQIASIDQSGQIGRSGSRAIKVVEFNAAGDDGHAIVGQAVTLREFVLDRLSGCDDVGCQTRCVVVDDSAENAHAAAR